MIQNQLPAWKDARVISPALHLEGGESKIRAWGGVRFQVSGIRLTKPEGESQKVGCQSKNGEGGGVEESPVGRQTEGDVAELVYLEEGEGKREEDGPGKGK